MGVEIPPPQDEARALLDSERGLQQVLDNSSAIVYAKDRRGRYIFVNHEFERVTGRVPASVLGRTDEETFPPWLASRFRRNDLVVLHENRSLQVEEAVDFGEGPRTFLSSKFPLRDTEGAVYAVCGISTDITDRKRLEEAFSAAALAVSQSEEETLYRQLARYLSTILGTDGAFIATVSPRQPQDMQMRAFHLDGEVRENFVYPLHGTPCATVLGQCYRVYPERLTELFPQDEGFRQLGLESYAGHPLTTNEGRPLGLIAAISRRPFADPALVEATLRIFAVRAVAEIERSEATAALRASEEQYRAVFNASADALVLWNSRHERVDINPAYERMYGYSRSEVLSGTRTRELAEEHRTLQAQIIARTLDGEHFRGEIETVHRDGTRFPIEVRTIPIQYQGEPHVLAMIRDLTEHRRVEEERSRLEARLRQAQKMEAIGQLTGGIAHDFNNLLTSIMGYVLLASQREAVSGDRRLGDFLAQAQRSCERARDLIQQMLMFSRGHRGSPRAVSLPVVVRGALATLQAGLPETLDLTVAVDSPVAPVHADPAQLEQVLLNLCLNSRDATGGVGRLRIEVNGLPSAAHVCASCREELRGSYVQLLVADDGHGMTAETQERIFEPFFSTKETGKGSGMGLAMVHGIVHEHGGHVLVDSRPGEGTRFSVLLPALDPARTVAEPTEAADAIRAPRPDLKGSVLVVDDEETVGEFMRELLQSWGLRAACVHRPEAALDLVRTEPRRFDVVITDQSMPRMTGLALARRLHAERADLPVILYTGHGDGLAGDELSHAALCAVLRKPIDPGQLSQVLARCLSTAGR